MESNSLRSNQVLSLLRWAVLLLLCSCSHDNNDDNGQIDNMVVIPAGSFFMGQDGLGVAQPVHAVTLTNGFLMSRTSVTNEQYLEALNWALEEGLVTVDENYVKQFGYNLLQINEESRDWFEIRYNARTRQFYLSEGTYSSGSHGPGFAYPNGYDPAIHPVKFVSWYGAACYCDWRSLMENLVPYYNGLWDQIPRPDNPYDAIGYRLPTEAEWEYAAQYPDERTYPWGNLSPICDIVNFAPSAPDSICVGWTSPSGAHLAGTSYLGLEDMVGNVTEWCNDWYEDYSSSPLIDPVGSVSGDQRVIRGGSWANAAEQIQLAYRDRIDPAWLYERHGFRICRSMP